MLASATAALQTPPCLFPYASSWGDYTVKYRIKYTAVVNKLPATFARISFLAVLVERFIHRDEMSSADDIAHLLNPRSADSTALSEIISDYFGGGGGPGRGRSRYVYIA